MKARRLMKARRWMKAERLMRRWRLSDEIKENMKIGSNRVNINTRMIVGNAIRMTVCIVFMLFASLLITGKDRKSVV